MPLLNQEDFNDKEKVTPWVEALNQSIQTIQTDTHKFKVSLYHDGENDHYIPETVITAHGVEDRNLLAMEFFLSKDYREMVQLGTELNNLIEDGAFIQRNDKKAPVDSFEQAIDWLMKEAKRGQSIQRYKGLGEMNPDQLWETTMDPNTRRMMKVTIEDAVAADEIFSTLMGDQVEPRREFIEDNALDAENIDV